MSYWNPDGFSNGELGRNNGFIRFAAQVYIFTNELMVSLLSNAPGRRCDSVKI
jgi:hypothetical protein